TALIVLDWYGEKPGSSEGDSTSAGVNVNRKRPSEPLRANTCGRDALKVEQIQPQSRRMSAPANGLPSGPSTRPATAISPCRPGSGARAGAGEGGGGGGAREARGGGPGAAKPPPRPPAGAPPVRRGGSAVPPPSSPATSVSATSTLHRIPPATAGTRAARTVE